ncbi:MAG: hormogonium polysaccharide biosynthesis glycosyltransferase HpsE [Spirulinaceae cyanobacterium]
MQAKKKIAFLSMPVDFTVAIPTYNGAKRLPEVLERLQQQLNPDKLNWEIVVIDNNSTDNTAQVIQAYQADWQQSYPLKYYLETQQGAHFARTLALQVASAPLVGFLDDDNLPETNWLTQADHFAKNHPQAGAYGGKIHPLYEVKPPANFHRIACLLAIIDRGSQPLLYNPQNRLLPPSAGLVVRKQAWQECAPPQQILGGRNKDSMLTSEDLEMQSYLQKGGWEIWYNPEMVINHKIPAWRLEKDYLINLVRGIGLSRYVTRTVTYKPWQKPLISLVYLINDLRKIMLHLLKYKFQVKTDLVAACEMELFVSSLSSPFYLWKNGYLKSRQ